MEEIKAVHGKDAFRSESVKDFFDLHPELERKRKKGMEREKIKMKKTLNAT